MYGPSDALLLQGHVSLAFWWIKGSNVLGERFVSDNMGAQDSCMQRLVCNSGIMACTLTLNLAFTEERLFRVVELKLLVHRAGIKAAAHRKEAAAGGGSCPAAAGSCPAGQGPTAHLNWSSASRRGRARLCLAVREVCRLASQVPVQRLRPHSSGLISTLMHACMRMG